MVTDYNQPRTYTYSQPIQENVVNSTPRTYTNSMNPTNSVYTTYNRPSQNQPKVYSSYKQPQQTQNSQPITNGELRKSTVRYYRVDENGNKVYVENEEEKKMHDIEKEGNFVRASEFENTSVIVNNKKNEYHSLTNNQ